MRIGELAKRADINVDTVRYYEKAGLLPPPPRLPNGYRDYGTPHLERLAFIRHCRALDMSLEEVQRLLDFVSQPDADCAVINQIIDSHLERVQVRIANLRTLESQLMMLRNQCQEQKTVAECGILQELVAAAQDEGCICHPTPRDENKATKRHSNHRDGSEPEDP
ncbi:MAG: Cd(II)/Pb(II)-responsive transcriptional regulator [Candidatus Thiodiazotropha sp.]|jgi:Cd(II)/Pb(II)-responsive transcriptional regulator